MKIDTAFVYLGIGVAVTLAVMFAILIWDRSSPGEDEIEDSTEAAFWDEQAQAARQDFGLAATRAAAGKWAATAASILGILSTVAIVAGPSALVDDVGGDAALVAAILVLVAGGLAAVATLLAGTAEQGSPVPDKVTGGKLRKLTRTRAQRAATQIRWSRILTVLSLVCIFTAAGVAWLKPLTAEDKPAGQSAVVVDSTGARCGSLTVASDGTATLKVGTVSQAIAAGSQVTLVDSCPK